MLLSHFVHVGVKEASKLLGFTTIRFLPSSVLTNGKSPNRIIVDAELFCLRSLLKNDNISTTGAFTTALSTTHFGTSVL